MKPNEVSTEFYALCMLVTALSITTICCSLAALSFGAYKIANIALNLTIFLIPLSCIGFLTFKRVKILLHPFGWFLVSASIYYGFGPLLYSFADQATVDLSDSFYHIDQIDLFSVNIMVSISFVMLVCAYLVFLIILSARAKGLDFGEVYQSSASKDLSSIIHSTRFLLILGVPLHFFIIVPADIGLVNWVVPGTVKFLSYTVYVVLIPLFLLKDSTLLGTFKLYGFMALLLLSAVISLSKSLIFLIPMTFVIILVLKEVSIKSIAMIAAVSVFVFVLVQPVILLARTFKAVSDQEVSSSMVKEVYSLSSQEDLSEIIAVTGGAQTWWARMNYANVQFFAIEQYDSGAPGKSLSDIKWILVPRFIYPSKPKISVIGNYFNESIDGNFNSASSPTSLIEGYWNYGWLGLFLCSVILGGMFYCWRRYTYWMFSHKKLQYLPIYFNGIMMGIFQDGWIVIGCFGGVIICILMHYILSISFNMLRQGAIFFRHA